MKLWVVTVSLFNLLLDACRKVARGIRSLFRSCLSCFGFCCRNDGDLVGDAKTFSYDALSDSYYEQESLFATCLSALKRVAQAVKSCLCELFGPCFPYCMRHHPRWAEDDDDLISVASDTSVSSSDFAKMHAAYSPAREALWYAAPEDPEAAKLLEEEEAARIQSSSDSSSDEGEYITTEPQSQIITTSAQVHHVHTTTRNVS